MVGFAVDCKKHNYYDVDGISCPYCEISEYKKTIKKLKRQLSNCRNNVKRLKEKING